MGKIGDIFQARGDLDEHRRALARLKPDPCPRAAEEPRVDPDTDRHRRREVAPLPEGHRALEALFDDGDVGYMPDWQWADLEVVSSA